jgi:hypothetical protein
LDFGQTCSTLIGSRKFVRLYLVYRILCILCTKYEVETAR